MKAWIDGEGMRLMTGRYAMALPSRVVHPCRIGLDVLIVYFEMGYRTSIRAVCPVFFKIADVITPTMMSYPVRGRLRCGNDG